MTLKPRQTFLDARNRLLDLREDYERACREFVWPNLPYFNWALDYFDHIGSAVDRTALRVVDDQGHDSSYSYAQLTHRSNQVANFLYAAGVRSGDRVMVMLGNVPALWETMLALIKLQAIVVPTTTLAGSADINDRIERARINALVTESRLTGDFQKSSRLAIKVSVGAPQPGWLAFSDSFEFANTLESAGRTSADQVMLLYFTSGTTAKPKIVAHTHRSYPVGHLSTMYWLGLRPGDIHLNLSSPGWAKHAWSSFFAPFNAEATVVTYNYERFQAKALLNQLVSCGITSLCAPPTVWRMLIQEDLAKWPVRLRELASAGEPLNPEVIEEVRSAWRLTIRDGFGQTETTALIGNPPGQLLKSGSMGKPLPGYRVVLMDAGAPVQEGEICLDVGDRSAALMAGYMDENGHLAESAADGLHHTGDIASRDADGYITYIGRADDVFKSSDYRISPFELESVLIEHEAVMEAAVVPSPDALRLAVPKAYVLLSPGWAPDGATATKILAFVNSRLASYKRIRRIEFSDLPKTISGKIRRVELRRQEVIRRVADERRSCEFWENDLASK